MSRYLVTFFKHLLSSDGHIFKSPQQSFRFAARKASSVPYRRPNGAMNGFVN